MYRNFYEITQSTSSINFRLYVLFTLVFLLAFNDNSFINSLPKLTAKSKVVQTKVVDVLRFSNWESHNQLVMIHA